MIFHFLPIVMLVPYGLTPLVVLVFHDRRLAGVHCVSLHAVQCSDIAWTADSIPSDTSSLDLLLISSLELHLVPI